MIDLDPLASALVAIAGVMSLFASRSIQRTGLVFMVANYLAWWGGLWIGDWLALIGLNAAAIYFTAKAPPTPATVTQITLSAGYLVSGIICLLYAFSWQTNNAQWVAYHSHTAITILQAAWLMGVSGGMLANNIRRRTVAAGPRLVALARKAHR